MLSTADRSNSIRSVLSEPVQARNSRSSNRRSIRIRSWRVPGDQAFAKAQERIDDSNGAGWQVHAPSVLAELTSTGKRELEKIKVAERWGGDHDVGKRS